MNQASPLWVCTALLAGLASSDPPGAGQAPPVQLAIGLTDQALLQRLGPPNRTSRQILLHRMIEQWHYGEPHNLRLTLERERGQPPSLKQIDRLPRPNP